MGSISLRQGAATGRAPSTSDVVRLALERLRRTPEHLMEELVDLAWREVETLPGRAKRGLPRRREPSGEARPVRHPHPSDGPELPPGKLRGGSRGVRRCSKDFDR